MRPLSLLAIAALVVAARAPAATAAGEPIATLDRPAPVSAYAGRLLWSRYDAAADRYRLVTRVAAQVSDVPVAPRAVPFDADLGPDARGATVAVYSRCRTDPPDYDGPVTPLYGKGKGCDLYRFDFATGRESAIASANAPHASEFWPTIWKGTLAFARTYDAKPDYPYIYTRPVSGRATSTRMPGGPRGACVRSRSTGATSCSDDRLSRPTALELYGRRLGFGWTYAGAGEGLANEIRLDTIGGGHARLATAGSGGLTQTEVDWPAFAGGAMFWSMQCFGDPAGCPGRFGLFRHRIATGATERAPGPAPSSPTSATAIRPTSSPTAPASASAPETRRSPVGRATSPRRSRPSADVVVVLQGSARAGCAAASGSVLHCCTVRTSWR